jgi:putative membrane protein
VVYGGVGLAKYFYYFVLITHIILAVVIVPMVLITLSRALKEKFVMHKRIARITLPLWLYVSLTGVIVYLMISPYYPY